MERILLVYGMVFVVALAAVMLGLRSDGSLSQKWAKVRVRSEENRRKSIPERREEEFDPGSKVELLILGTILLLICLFLSKV